MRKPPSPSAARTRAAVQPGELAIQAEGFTRYSTWEHSERLRRLYERRCLRQEPEMTAHAQAAELLARSVRSGDTVLDVGCGSGYFYHSLVKRALPVTYLGIDASATLVAIGQRHLPAFGLPASALRTVRIEDLAGAVDHVVCLNVLTFLDNYHRPLERLLLSTRATVILRESLGDRSVLRYVADRYLDPGIVLKTYVNTYALDEVVSFIESYGFEAQVVTDQFTGGRRQVSIGYPHYWKFVVARR